MDRIEWISMMHKQNLNGRETEDELFEAGILAGIEETTAIMYSEEDMRKAYSLGWITRERFDDLSPDIIYPKGLDYEEKQDYAFNLWFENYKK